MKIPNEILKKKILIYGLGKSGISSFKYLHHKNECFVYDDNLKIIKKNLRKYFQKKLNIANNNFDYIVISPGIDIHNCSLSKYLKKNKKKIITELDVFYIFNPEILTITITGTNGKTTTCKLLYDILKKHRFDVRLTGNVGNPLLEEKKVKKNSIFIVEASSYQLEYSKWYRSKFSLIINIAPDHLDRHLSMKNYINAKLKAVIRQKKNDICIVQNNVLIKKILKTKKIKSKIIFLKKNKYSKIRNKIKNDYFKKSVNFQNAAFLMELSKHLKLKFKIILKSINNFIPLRFRQELIYNTEKLKVINDSKSTSLSSTIPFLKTEEKIYWIVGGIYKKGDKFNLEKKYCKNLRAFIYGKDKFIFSKLLLNKCNIELKNDLKSCLNLIYEELNKENDKITILFSPSAASFDQFKNFEDRGEKFDLLIRKYLLSK